MPIDEIRLEIIKAYIDGAKSFINLCSAGLILPLVLTTDVMGLFNDTQELSLFVLVFISISWLSFLVSIGSGVLYQYTAVKFIEYLNSPETTFVPKLLKYLVQIRGPGVAFGVMVISFYVGAISVVIYSFAAIVF